MLIHLSISTAGLSLKEHYELAFLLASIHIPAILLCVITAILSLFEIYLLTKILLAISLGFTVLTIASAWANVHNYFSALRRFNYY